VVGRNDAVGVQACIDDCFSAMPPDDGSSLACTSCTCLPPCFQDGEDCAPLWAKSRPRVPFSTQVTGGTQEELDAW
jgi:hypothetical protein